MRPYYEKKREREREREREVGEVIEEKVRH
jgi:hypothetical protein